MERVFSLGVVKSAPYLKKLEKNDSDKVRVRAKELLKKVSGQASEPLVIRVLGLLEVSRGGRTLLPQTDDHLQPDRQPRRHRGGLPPLQQAPLGCLRGIAVPGDHGTLSEIA
jgi:hypothetical protein